MRRRYYHHDYYGRRHYRGPARQDYRPGRRRGLFSTRSAVVVLLAMAALVVLASLV